jgi:hypothetical protein
MPSVPRSLLAVLVALAALALPAAALPQSAPELGAPEPEETTPAPGPTDPSDDGLETWQQVLIFAAGVVLLGGISVAIIGDARHRAGRDGRPALTAEEQRDASRHGRQAAKRRARQKARAARAARKRNR